LEWNYAVEKGVGRIFLIEGQNATRQLLGQLQSLRNLMVPQFQKILNNPGVSAADKAAITGRSQGALASRFDSLQQVATDRAEEWHLGRESGPAEPAELSELLNLWANARTQKDRNSWRFRSTLRPISYIMSTTNSVSFALASPGA
jgi:hypothetical protein